MGAPRLEYSELLLPVKSRSMKVTKDRWGTLLTEICFMCNTAVEDTLKGVITPREGVARIREARGLSSVVRFATGENGLPTSDVTGFYERMRDIEAFTAAIQKKDVKNYCAKELQRDMMVVNKEKPPVKQDNKPKGQKMRKPEATSRETIEIEFPCESMLGFSTIRKVEDTASRLLQKRLTKWSKKPAVTLKNCLGQFDDGGNGFKPGVYTLTAHIGGCAFTQKRTLPGDASETALLNNIALKIIDNVENIPEFKSKRASAAPVIKII